MGTAYRTEVNVKSLSVKDWIGQYCFGDAFKEYCRQCPDYGRVWSCPPGVPKVSEYLMPYEMVYVVGVKVIYSDALKMSANSPDRTEQARQSSYGKVKRTLMEALLALEEIFPDSLTVSAGRCEICARCTREDGGRPCRYPAHLRYSFSGFGFDLCMIARDLLGFDLLWSSEGLPDYNVAVAAFLTNSAAEKDTIRDMLRGI